MTLRVLQADTPGPSEAAELNAQQNIVLAKTRAQLASADHGIQTVQDFLDEAGAPAPVNYLVAVTVLEALQAFFASKRVMASKILEFRICDLSPEASGISDVIARYLVGDDTTVEKMRCIRTFIMSTLSGFPGILQRLELESCDGEHFKLLWQLAEAPQSAWELWDQNDAFVDAMEKEWLKELRHGNLSTSAKVDLREKYFGYYVRRFGMCGCFTILCLPRASTPISDAVKRMGLGGEKAARPVMNDADYTNWWKNLKADQRKYGSDCETSGCNEPSFYKVGEICQYVDLRHKFRDHKVGYEYFKDAVLHQNFTQLALHAQSESRKEAVFEEISKSLEGQDGAVLQEILTLLKGSKTSLELIQLLTEMFPFEALERVCEIYRVLRYSERVWLVQKDPVLGKTLAKHEDFFHKLKRVASSVRTQQLSPDGKLKGSLGPPLLDKQRLLAIALKKPKEHKVIINALTGTGSDAMDPYAQSRMFVSETFYKDVEAEDKDLALCLKTIGEWYHAQDQTGLSATERARRMSNMYDLFYAVLGRYWYCCKKPPSNIAGLPLRLWFAVVAAGDSARVLIEVKLGGEFYPPEGNGDGHAGKKRAAASSEDELEHGRSKKPRISEECWAEQANPACDAHTQACARARELRSRSPGTFQLVKRVRNQLIKLRYTGTYDLEGGFSALVMIAGYKPALRVALGVLRRAQILSHIRAMPGRGFHFPRSQRARYDYAVHRKERGRRLADEWFGIQGFVKKHSKRDVQRGRILGKEPVVHVRTYSKRSEKGTGLDEAGEQSTDN